MLTGAHQDPGNAETPVDELPAVRLCPPGVAIESEEAWFIELLTVGPLLKWHGHHCSSASVFLREKNRGDPAVPFRDDVN
jgi:hypothetical protein